MKTFKQFLSEEVKVLDADKYKIPQDRLDIILDAIPKMLKVLKIEYVTMTVDFFPQPGANATAHAGLASKHGRIMFNPAFVKKASIPDLLDTIAHELIHVWQSVEMHLDDRDPEAWWMGGKKHNPGAPWKKRPWEQQAVLNSWQLVKKAGLTTADSKGGLSADHWHAKRLGRENNLHIRHLYSDEEYAKQLSKPTR